MRRGLFRTIVVFLAMVPVSMSGLNASIAGEKPGPKYVYFIEDTLKASDAEAYRNTLKQMTALVAEQKYPFAWETFWNETQSKIYLAFPMNALDDYERINEAFGNAFRPVIDRALPLLNESATYVETNTRFFTEPRYGPSYEPEQPAFTADAKKSYYCKIIEYRLHDGQQGAFEGVLNEYVNLLKTQQAAMAMQCSRIPIGEELPRYWVVWRAATQEDLSAQAEQLNALLGDAGREIIEKSQPLVKKIQVLELTHIPDLSYFPGGN